MSLNHLGCSEVVQDRGMDVSPPRAPPPGWEVFTWSLKEHCSDPESLDVQGRYVCEDIIMSYYTILL